MKIFLKIILSLWCIVTLYYSTKVYRSEQVERSILNEEVLRSSSQNVDYISSYNTVLTSNGRYTTRKIGKNRSVIYRDNDDNETILLKKGWYCNLQVVNGYLYATDISGPFDKPARTICLDLKGEKKEIWEGVQIYYVFDDNSVLYYKVPEKTLYYKNIEHAATGILENSECRILAGEGDLAIIQEERNNERRLYFFQNGKIKAERTIPDTMYALKISDGYLYFFVNKDDSNDKEVVVYREEMDAFFANEETKVWNQPVGVKTLREWVRRYSPYILPLENKRFIEEKCENLEFMSIENSEEYICFLRKDTDTIMLYENAIMINDEIFYYDISHQKN